MYTYTWDIGQDNRQTQITTKIFDKTYFRRIFRLYSDVKSFEHGMQIRGKIRIAKTKTVYMNSDRMRSDRKINIVVDHRI